MIGSMFLSNCLSLCYIITIQLMVPVWFQWHFSVLVAPVVLMFYNKTHVRGFFDTDIHEVSWHFATNEAVRPSGF